MLAEFEMARFRI